MRFRFAAQLPLQPFNRFKLWAAIVACAAVWGTWPVASALASYTPRPVEPAEIVPVGSTAKAYLLLSPHTPLRIELIGPGTLRGYARVHFAAEQQEPKNGRLVVLGIPAEAASVNLSFKPSAKSRYADGREGVPSAGRKFSWSVPNGAHTVELLGDCQDGSAIFVVLYYDGPPQPGAPPKAATPATPRRATARAAPLLSQTQVGLDLIYDSNFLSNSDDYLDDWHAGRSLYKFRMKTEDDLIISPSFETQIRRRLTGLGQTRLRVKCMLWHYLANPIKNNQEYDVYLRQYLGKDRSLELYYFFAPEQYIRQLSDRPPNTPQDDPLGWKEFRFTKNTFGLTYRQGLSRAISSKLLFERNLRYYNRPFIENDIDAWEVRGVLYWRLHRSWRLQFDYSYEDAAALALDEIGENKETSDNSDASYERDLFRIGVNWRPRFLRRVVDDIDLSGLLMKYYYTTDKSLAEDSYHSGRKDQVVKISCAIGRRLSKTVSAALGVRWTQRTVDSPSSGDVALDKDYTKYRTWLSLTYKL